LGETFILETVDTGHVLMTSEADMNKPRGPMAGNPSTGPVYVEGIHAGEVISVEILDLKIVGHCKIGIGKETLLPEDAIIPRSEFIRIENGYALFSGGLKAPVRPMLGCFGVVPLHPSPEPWHHGGNLDLPDIAAGSTTHLRSQRDGAWFACGDGHALQGDGEINGYSLEVSLEGVFRINKSPYQDLQTILIETHEKVITVGVEKSFAESIRLAEISMADFYSKRMEVSLLDAYQFTSHAGDIRVGPIWEAVRIGKWEAGIPIPACVQIANHFFINPEILNKRQ
jgi:amidase